MKNKKLIIVIGICFTFILVVIYSISMIKKTSTTVNESPKVSAKVAVSNEKKAISVKTKNLETKNKSVVTLNDSDYSFKPSFMAIPKALYKNSLGKKYKEQSGYVIYRLDEPEKKITFDSESLPIFFNEDTQSFAILTGKVIIKLQDSSEVDEIEKETGLIFEKDLPFIKRYIFDGKKVNNIIDLYKKLVASHQYLEVELEIINSDILPK